MKERRGNKTHSMRAIEGQGDRAVDDLSGTQMMPVKSIVMEDGAQDMIESPDLQPYLRYIEASMTGQGRDKARETISELPLERRYIWRVVLSLRRAFCDFDRSSIRADLNTMDAKDFDSVVTLLDGRQVQLAMLLRTVFGSEQMEEMLQEAISISKRF